jgi:AcrR family transcriptional regulator
MPAGSKSGSEEATRPRGRPRVDIDLDAVADAVAELFVEGGIDAVTIPEAADKLSVSRATLYRTVSTKEHLLGILFERSTRELLESARAAVAQITDPSDQLDALVRLHVAAAIKMQRYMPVFFGGGDLPTDVFERWHTFAKDFENTWIEVVADNMKAGHLVEGDPVVTTRLLIGACTWVSRWYRSDAPYDAQLIIDTAAGLLRQSAPPAPSKRSRRAGK